MDLSRRDFLKATGISGIGLALSSLGFDLTEAKSAAHMFKLKGAREFTTISHFCACGCGVIGYVKGRQAHQPRGCDGQPNQSRCALQQGTRLRDDPELEGARDEAAVPRTGERPLGGDQLE